MFETLNIRGQIDSKKLRHFFFRVLQLPVTIPVPVHKKTVLLLIFFIWPCAFSPIFGPRTAGRLDGSPLHVDGATGGAHRCEEMGVLDALVIQVVEPLNKWIFPGKAWGNHQKSLDSPVKHGGLIWFKKFFMRCT